ncbi:MAG: cupin domain-containing protein [Pirellulales bacterium]|nr:cupin domain-containing protein [Pirellulales bacterium]
MTISCILAEITPAEFTRDYYYKQPFSQRGTATGLRELGSWKAVEEILAEDDADFFLARQGARWEGKRQPDYSQVRRLHDEGYTLVIRHAEHQHAGLRELATGFEADFRAPVNVHVYCTPAESFGFAWHYDAEEVFFIQTEGTKEYSLRKNTVNPWPLEETLPVNMRYEREIMPLMRCLLEPDDWLYLPAGYWHMGQSAAPSITLAVGVMSRSGVDAFDVLRTQLLDSLLWRQRLPVSGNAAECSSEELEAKYRELLQQLADDVSKQLTSVEFARTLMEFEVPSPRS